MRRIKNFHKNFRELVLPILLGVLVVASVLIYSGLKLPRFAWATTITNWRFDEGTGTTADDATSNANNGTITNAVWTKEDQCISGKCLKFDGTGDYVSKTYSSDTELDPGTASFSISAWFNHPSAAPAANQFLISRFNGAGYKLYMNTSGQICFGIDADATWTPTDSACSASSFADSSWHLAEGVKSGTSSITLYVDGVKVGENTSLGASTTLSGTSPTFYVGIDSDGSSGGWVGFIDDVKYYNAAQSASDAKNDYNAGKSAASHLEGVGTGLGKSKESNDAFSKGLTGYWKFDETSGNAADSAGSGSSLINNATTTYSAGKFGNAPTMNGTTQYFNTTNNISSVKTIAFWTYPHATTDYFVDLDGTRTIDASSGTVRANNFTQATIYVNGLAGTTIAANAWSHVAVTTTDTVNTGNSLRVGRLSSSYMDGQIDEFRLYNRVFSAKEIADLYSFAPGPVAWWKMDGNTGSGVDDSSGNGTTLTNTNSTPYASGKFGSALNFTAASSQYAYAADNATLSLTSDLTVDAWIYPKSNTAATEYEIAGKWDNTNQSYLLAQYGDEIRFYVDSSSNYVTTDAANLSTGTWYHVAAQYNAAAQSVNVYVNGVKQATTTTGTIPTSIGDDAGRFHIGTKDSTGGSGTIDATVGASTDDIYQTTGGAVNTASTTAILGTGNTATHPHRADGFRWTNITIPQGATITNSYIQINKRGNEWITTDFTWYGNDVDNAATFSDAEVVTDRVYTTASLAVSEDWNATDGVYYQIPSTGNLNTIVKEIVDRASWASGNAMAFIGDGNGTTSYAQSNINHWDNGSSLAPKLHIEYSGGGANSYYNGKIDDVKIYNYARSAKQITEDMNGGHPAPGSPVGSAVGWWKFDEGADNTCSGGVNDVCNSGSGGATYDGAETGMAVPASATSGWTNSGKFGKALSFDGIDDYVQTGYTQSPGSGQVSISAWINVASAASGTGVIMSQQNGSYYESAVFKVSFDNNFIQFYRDYGAGTGGSWYTNDNSITKAVWQHVVVSHDASSTSNVPSLYINGIKQTLQFSQQPTGTPDSSTHNWYIGRHEGTTLPFNGAIDDVRIYNFALTADEVKMEYNRGSAIQLGALGDNSSYEKSAANQEYCVPGDGSTCSPPVGEWRLDENKGNTAYDTSGNGYSSASFAGSTTWTIGKFGTGLTFDGVDDNVRITEAANIDLGATTDSYTVSSWFKTGTTYTGSGSMLAKDSGTAVFPFELYISSSQFACFKMSDGTNTPSICGATALNDDKWHHAAAVRDVTNDKLYLYVDGASAATAVTDSTAATAANNADVSLGNAGASYTAYDFKGSLDQVRIYNYARTAAQIAWDYNRGAPLAWYKIDECTGATIYNAAQNANGQQVTGIDGTIEIGATGTQDGIGTCTDGDTTNARYNGRNGKFNSSLNFDGADDHVTFPSGFNYFTNGITISLWAYPTTAGYYARFIELGTSCNTNNIMLGRYGVSNQIAYQVAGSNTLSEATLELNNWQHIVATQNSAGTVNIYKNGVRLSTTGSSPVPGNVTRTVNYLGDSLCTHVFDAWYQGEMDDVRLYNYPLTTTQIKLLYNEGAAVRFAPVTGSP